LKSSEPEVRAFTVRGHLTANDARATELSVTQRWFHRMQVGVVQVQAPIPRMQVQVVRVQVPIPRMQVRVVRVQALIPRVRRVLYECRQLTPSVR